MKDYASMSDREINREVQKLTGMGCMSGNGVLIISDGMWRTFDPCNNPADAWPIIIGQKLSLINADDEWLCVPDYATVDGVAGDDIQKIYFSYGYVDANPLRCAMIVFLMMKEGE